MRGGGEIQVLVGQLGNSGYANHSLESILLRMTKYGVKLAECIPLELSL